MNEIRFDLSILIVNYNTKVLLMNCLKSIYRYTERINFEILVIDNQSTDDSENQIRLAYPANLYPNLIWLNMAYNAGFGRANNFGMSRACGRNILLLNSDTLLIDNLIGRCSHLLDIQLDVAAVGAMQIDRQGNVRHGIFTSFNSLLRFSFILPRRLENTLYWLLPDPIYRDSNEVDWIIGAFLMTRAVTVSKAGKLDENFFLYSEDVEWSYRLGKQGRMLVLRDSFFVHFEYGSNPIYQTQQINHINRFKTQMQVSILLWIRKQYGAVAYLVFMLHYLTLIPILYLWGINVNIIKHKPLLDDLSIQRNFTRQIGEFMNFFWKTLCNKSSFYKV